MRFVLTNLIGANYCRVLDFGKGVRTAGQGTLSLLRVSRASSGPITSSYFLDGVKGKFNRSKGINGRNCVYDLEGSSLRSNLSSEALSRLGGGRTCGFIKDRRKMKGVKLAKTKIVMLDGISYYSDSSVMKVMEFRDLRKNLTKDYPFGGPQRITIPDDKIEWSTHWPEYDPPEFTSPSIVSGDKDWMDKDLRLTDVGLWPKWNQQDGGINRRSHHCNYYTDADGYPLNPAGRTGIKGRGNLGRWATNHAADCLITRWKKMEDGSTEKRDGRSVLQFIGIIRKDTGDAAFPGGMIDAGEDAMTAVKREFLEEVFNAEEATEEERFNLEDALKDVFATGETVYKGYVDDRRNTDNAWIETEAINFFLSKEDEDLFQNLKFKAGSDASGALWIDVDQNVKLYASHKSIIQILVQKLDAYW